MKDAAASSSHQYQERRTPDTTAVARRSVPGVHSMWQANRCARHRDARESGRNGRNRPKRWWLGPARRVGCLAGANLGRATGPLAVGLMIALVLDSLLPGCDESIPPAPDGLRRKVVL